MPKQLPFMLKITAATQQMVVSAGCLLAVLVLVYLPSFSGTWVYDDGPNILQNGNVHMERFDLGSVKQAFYLKHQGVDGTERIKRPLAYLSFALNWYFGKDRTLGYHLVNFAIHLVTALFLYLFLKDTLRLPIFKGRYDIWAHPGALLATLFWALHPIQVTAVTYIVQRMASMAGMFTIMSMFAYLKSRTAVNRAARGGYGTVCGLAALCAFATKENSAILPVSVFAFEMLVIRGVEHVDWKKTAIWGSLALGVTVLLGLLYVHPQILWEGYANRPFTPLERVLTEPRVMFHYLSMLIYPLHSKLMLVHDLTLSTSLWSPWTTLPAILGVAFLLAISLFRLSRSHPLIAFAVIFFFLNHAIEGSFLCLEPIYEHRNYIPSMMLALIPALSLLQALHFFSYRPKFQLGIVVGGALVLACVGHTTYAYNNRFRHGLAFWRSNAAKAPRLSVVQNNYAIELMKAGFNDRAHQALERAIALDRYFNRAQQGVTFHNMGLYQERILGNDRAALAYFKKANGITLDSPEMKLALARSLLVNDDLASARQTAAAAIDAWPHHPDFLILMGKLALREKKFSEALDYGRRARELRTGLPAGLALWGEVYRLQGDRRKAIFFWRLYRRQRPRSPVAAVILAQLYAQDGNREKLAHTVNAMGILKGDLTWRAWLKEVARQARHWVPVDTFDPEVVLPVIFGALKKEALSGISQTEAPSLR